jgi:glycine cleavage system regulatory protein
MTTSNSTRMANFPGSPIKPACLNMGDRLLVCVMGEDRIGMVERFTALVAECGLHVEGNFGSTLDGAAGSHFIVGGHGGRPKRLDDLAKEIENPANWKLAMSPIRVGMVLDVTLIARDKIGLLNRICRIFSASSINMTRLEGCRVLDDHGDYAAEFNIVAEVPQDKLSVIDDLRRQLQELALREDDLTFTMRNGPRLTTRTD